MRDFLRRIPAMLGLKSKPQAPAAVSQPAPAKASNGAVKKAPQGRGAGRGTTPKAKPKGNRQKNAGKK
jgi:hypothetical protein